MKITVVGLGYVGLSNAILLSLNNEVVGVDSNKDRVEMIGEGKSPLKDKEIIDYLKKDLNLRVEVDGRKDYRDSDFVVISVPTNYDDENHFFDTSIVEKVIKEILEENRKTTIIIKSTIPIGFTDRMKEEYSYEKIIFSPEFLREGRALHDCLNPARIIVGDRGKEAETFANLLKEGADNNPETLLMGSQEAEAVKLFANTYLAMRVAYFNELDTFAQENHMDTKEIIDAICLDPRIGAFYNNPSFGYGGYCLPKDTKQLLANFEGIPQSLIGAIVSSNDIRKKYIADKILEKKPETVGIFRLTMKSGSDNFRKSAIFDIIGHLKEAGKKILIYEPTLEERAYEGLEVEKDLEGFKKRADIIVANRLEEDLKDVEEKVYTRDLFKRD